MGQTEHSPAESYVVLSSDRLYVTINGACAFFTAHLSVLPTHPVTLSCTSTSLVLHVSPPSWTFTPDNYADAYIFRVDAIPGMSSPTKSTDGEEDSNNVLDSTVNSGTSIQSIEVMVSSVDPRFHSSYRSYQPTSLIVHLRSKDGNFMFCSGYAQAAASSDGKDMKTPKTEFYSTLTQVSIFLRSHRRQKLLLQDEMNQYTPLTQRNPRRPTTNTTKTRTSLMKSKNIRPSMCRPQPSTRKLSLSLPSVLPVTHPNSTEITKVACQGNRSAVLGRNGYLIMLGEVLSKTSTTAKVTRNKNFHRDGKSLETVADVLRTYLIVDVDCSETHVAAVTERGNVLTWGDESMRGLLGHGQNHSAPLPQVIGTLIHKRIRQVACGLQHTVALSEDGSVFTWGDGGMGALGHGLKTNEQNFDSKAVPTEVISLRSKQYDTVHKVACGEMHTVMVTQRGRVLTCGRAQHGTLGRRLNGYQDGCSVLTPITLPPQQNKSSKLSSLATSVACGTAFTLVLTASNSIVVFGSNDRGQLGLGDRRDRMKPTLVPYFDTDHLPVVSVEAGRWHSLALVQDGRMFAWGSDELSQCSLSDLAEIYTVPRFVLSAFGFGITQIAAGSGHTIVITKGSTRYIDTKQGRTLDVVREALEDDSKRRKPILKKAEVKTKVFEASKRQNWPHPTVRYSRPPESVAELIARRKTNCQGEDICISKKTKPQSHLESPSRSVLLSHERKKKNRPRTATVVISPRVKKHTNPFAAPTPPKQLLLPVPPSFDKLTGSQHTTKEQSLECQETETNFRGTNICKNEFHVSSGPKGNVLQPARRPQSAPSNHNRISGCVYDHL